MVEVFTVCCSRLTTILTINSKANNVGEKNTLVLQVQYSKLN